MTVKDTVLNKNKNTGHSNDFGIVICYSPEDAEYLLRVVSSPDFLLMGSRLTGTLSKLTRESFYELYGNIQATESLQEQNYQQQQYLQAYYKSFFEHLANSGYYYDATTNEYRRLEDRNSFEQVALDTVVPTERKEALPLIEVAISEPTGAMLNEPAGHDTIEKMADEKEIIILKEESQMGVTPDQQNQAVKASLDSQVPLQPTMEILIGTDEPVAPTTVSVFCKLCKRGFESDTHLGFHKRYSALHKKHLLEDFRGLIIN